MSLFKEKYIIIDHTTHNFVVTN